MNSAILAVLLSTILIFGTNDLVAQKTFTVRYLYRVTKDLEDSFYLDIARPAETITQFSTEKRLYPIVQKRFNKVDSNVHESICTYAISDTSCSILRDGFGYETFVIPGDTVSVYVDKKLKVDGHYWVNRDSGYKCVWFHNFSFEGRNRYIYSLFDSLAFYTDIIQYGGVNFLKANMLLDSFFQILTSKYNARLKYLTMYCTDHDIPSWAKQFAYYEIRSAYITNLTQPMSNLVANYSKSEYPEELLDTLSAFNSLDDETLCFKTLLYGDAVYAYISLYRVNFLSSDSNQEDWFQKIYMATDSIESNSKRIREHLLSYCLLKNLKNDFVSMPSFLDAYRSEFKNSPASKYLDSVYSIEKNKATATNHDALNNLIKSTKGDTLEFKELMKSKPVMIDCWASWCGPCILQVPFEKELEKKYAGKVDFIYLSFDINKDSWSKKIQELGLDSNRSYLLEGNFKSKFAHHFNIESIPHYLIFDQNGKLVSSDAPRPSNSQALAMILDKLLQRENK